MPTINIAPTEYDPGTTEFDPTRQKSSVGKGFSMLRAAANSNFQSAGGRFSVPSEFDAAQFAAAFHPEGNEAAAMRMPQPVVGTGWEADGWEIWKYPSHTNQQKVDEDGDPIYTKVGKDDKVPAYVEHPNAGEPHRVPSLEKGGVTYVLMFRPIEVQNQVNEAYGLLSMDNMAAEARGETIAGHDPNDKESQSMLSTKQLNRVEGAIIEADRDYEERLGRSTVVQSSIPSNTGRLTKPPKKLSR